MSRRYLIYCGLLIVSIAIAISLLFVDTREGVPDVLTNRELVVNEQCNVWFPKRFSKEEKFNYINHVGDYSELLVYIDSMSCSSCQIRHLYNWLQFAEQIEKDQGIKVLPIIIISPSEADTLRLKYEYINSIPIIPVIIENVEFLNCNTWLKDLHHLTVLLLDKKRRVRRIYKY